MLAYLGFALFKNVEPTKLFLLGFACVFTGATYYCTSKYMENVKLKIKQNW